MKIFSGVSWFSIVVALFTLIFVVGCGGSNSVSNQPDVMVQEMPVDNNETEELSYSCDLEDRHLKNPDSEVRVLTLEYVSNLQKLTQLKDDNVSDVDLREQEIVVERKAIDVSSATYKDILHDFKNYVTYSFIKHIKLEEKLASFFNSISEDGTVVFKSSQTQINWENRGIHLFNTLKTNTTYCHAGNECKVQKEDGQWGGINSDYFDEKFSEFNDNYLDFRKIIAENPVWIKALVENHGCSILKSMSQKTRDDLRGFIEDWIASALETAKNENFKFAISEYLTSENFVGFQGDKSLSELRLNIVLESQLSFDDSMAVYRLFSDNHKIWSEIFETVLDQLKKI